MKSSLMSFKKFLLIISVIFLLAATIRIICFVGLIGSDDLNYNRTAYAIATGTFTSTLDHQRTRIGLLLPVAAMFRVFGVNELSSIMFSFLYFLLTFGALVYITTTYWGKWAGIIAGLLYTLLPLEIFYATMLLPDLPSAACIALSGSILCRVDPDARSSLLGHSHLSRKTGAKACVAMFLGGAAFGWAYLIRETALFFGVFVVGYMLYKALNQRILQWTWLWFWLGFFAIIGIELGYYYWTLGSPFYRYLSIESSANVPGATERFRRYFYKVSSLAEYLSFDRFRVLFYVPDFSFYYFFVFAGIIYGIYKRLRQLWFFIGWFLTLFLLYSFASKSLSAYIPLRSVSRYFLALSFPGIIIMSRYLQEMAPVLTLKNRREQRPFLVSLAFPWMLVFMINLLWFSAVRMLFLLSILLLWLILFSETLRGFLLRRLSQQHVHVVIPLILLYISLLPGIYMAAKGERPRKGITCERDIRQLFEFPLTHTIYTDSRTEAILEYFYQYQYDEQILQFTDADVTTLNNTYVIANWERLFFLERVHNTDIPEFLYHPPPQWRRYAKIGGYVNPCLIYEIQ